MRSLILSILTVSLLLIPANSQADTIELKVMTFNIRFGTANDGVNSWDNRRNTLVNCIKAYSPDIMGTQETLKFQAEYIREKLPQYESFGLGRVNDGTGERMEIFYNPKVLSPIEIGHFWLSTTPDIPASKDWDTSLPRMATWAKFWHIESQQYLFYLNTHFDHRGAIARKEASRVITEQVNSLAGDLPVIITGDFNAAGGTSEPWKELAKNFKDTWLHAKEQIGPPYTFGGFKPPVPDIERRIDWIFYRGSFEINKSETVLYNEKGKYPSDHLPVYAEFSLKLK